MLEKLITNLKNSLPAPIRKKLGMEGANEEQELDEEADSNEQQDDENQPDTDDAAAKRKKQINMAIRVGLILVVAYLAIDEFFLKSNKSEPSVDEMLASMPAKRKKPKKAVEVKTETPPSEATVSTTANEAETAVATEATTSDALEIPPATDTAVVESPPIENINVLDKNESLGVAPETQVQIENPSIQSTEVVTESSVVDTSVDKKIDQLANSLDQSPLSTEEVVIPSEPAVKDKSMASKIVEVATETPAPAYDQIGRGLVYNCKDKYWACVDKPAFLLCNKNMKWNDSKGNAKECVVRDIYNTDEDCAKVQKYNVTMSVATSFCQ